MQSKNFVCAFMLMVFAGFSTACEKNQEEELSTELDPITAGIVAELSSTLTQDLAKIGTHSVQGQLLTTGVCGATKDTTFSNAVSEGNFSKTGSMNLKLTLNCNQLKVPTSVKIVAVGSGNLDSKILSSSSESDGDFTLTGLAKSASTYQLDGSLIQIAQPVSKVRNETHFYS